MNVLALCSGCLGLELGLQLAGAAPRVVLYVERDATSAGIVAGKIGDGRLPPAPVWSDLRTLDARPWRGLVDCVTAGYPCQPFSSAGHQLGAADERHLWPHVARIVADVEPAIVFCENVTGHVRNGLAEVLADLRALGFAVEAGTFTADEVGAPHVRRRVFVLAVHPDRTSDAQGVGSSTWPSEPRQLAGHPERLRGAAPVGVGPDADGDGSAQLAPRGLHGDRSAWDYPHGLRRAPWTDGQVPQPSILGVADGLADQLDLFLRPLPGRDE